MAKDLVYYFSKVDFSMHELGEIQTNFNMSFVIDGTKDSAKVILKSFEETEVEPNTIVFHAKTKSWWIVSHDKVGRYQYENKPIYNHELQLVGAIELLNARDLTDCGFYQNKYTIREFFFRLLKLSNLEFNENNVEIFLNDNNLLNLDKKVDYIKTFENYTLLSAIRELFDAYNINVKLVFGVRDNVIKALRFDLYSKSGDTRRISYESVFNDVRETKTMDRNSFATSVVSNAENVISTKEKVYPTVGGVRATGTQYTMTPSNSIVRLPSNIHKLNWLKIIKPISIKFNGSVPSEGEGENDGPVSDVEAIHESFQFDATDDNLSEQLMNQMVNRINSIAFGQSIREDIRNTFAQMKEKIFAPARLAGSTTLYTGWKYDPISNEIIAPQDNPNFYKPYFVIKTSNKVPDPVDFQGTIGVCDKETRDNLNKPVRAFYYERGKNYIGGLDMLTSDLTNQRCYNRGYIDTDLRDNRYNDEYVYLTLRGKESGWYLEVSLQITNERQYSIGNTKFIVNYVPMSDLKIKMDNDADRRDTHLYNQNGKLNDSVALSKLLISYAKEVQSDTITKYMTSYDYNTIPKVGGVVIIKNDFYVINNVSYDFAPNENDSYEIKAEYTMSKYVATKSLLTSPNSNIRDYGIPQNNNIVRKQLYRDFYELAHSIDTIADNDKYMGLDKIMNVSSKYKEFNEHIGVIKLGFKKPYGGETEESKSDTWYYQLDATTYILKKSVYQVIDFNDNNIIGYGSQSVSCGFDITRIFSGTTDYINTPISYVDDEGEFESVEIAFTTKDELTKIYNYYVEHKKQQYGYSAFIKTIYNYSVFIDSEIYEGINVVESFTYVGEFEYSPFLSGYTATIDLMDKNILPSDFSGSVEELSINTIRNVIGYTNIKFEKYSNNHIILTFRFLSFLTPTDRTINLTIDYSHFVHGAKQINDFVIRDMEYNKDPIEVPVFEYSCQIDDSNDILIGSNILDTNENDLCYFYQFATAIQNTINDNNFENMELEDITFADNIFSANNVVRLAYNEDKLEIVAYENETFDPTTEQASPIYRNQLNIADLINEKDLVVVRVKPIKNGDEITYEKDLMFVIRNTDKAIVEDNTLKLVINHYKLN